MPSTSDPVPSPRRGVLATGAPTPHSSSPSATSCTLRIAHVSDYFLPRLGGIEMLVDGLARHQRQVGHEVDVITPRGVAGGQRGVVGAVAEAAGTFAGFSPAAIEAATDIVISGGYDVVHAHAGLATPLSLAAASAASRAGVPTVVTVHSMLGRLSAVYRALDQVTGWRDWPVAWAAVSRAAAAPLIDLLGSAGIVDVLPNAIDLDAWSVGASSLDGDVVAHRDEVVVAAVMRLARRKRPFPLLKILRAVRRATPPEVGLRAVIVGEGRERASLERSLARHGMASWVSLPGSFDHAQIRRVLRHADVFVAPAIRESFGIAALEARTAGLPVVAMGRSGVAEFLEDGRAGFLVDDDRAMADALTRLVNDPTTRSAMALHNRRVRPPFGWESALQRTDVVYARAAALQRATPVRCRGDVPAAQSAIGALVAGGWPA